MITYVKLSEDGVAQHSVRCQAMDAPNHLPVAEGVDAAALVGRRYLGGSQPVRDSQFAPVESEKLFACRRLWVSLTNAEQESLIAAAASHPRVGVFIENLRTRVKLSESHMTRVLTGLETLGVIDGTRKAELYGELGMVLP